MSKFQASLETQLEAASGTGVPPVHSGVRINQTGETPVPLFSKHGFSPPTTRPRIPAWIRTRPAGGDRYLQLRTARQGFKLHTVCEEAKCPNIGECWSHGTATFMLMGDTCTRRCNFCSVNKGQPGHLDPNEPAGVAEVIAAMQLDYAVLTSVNRDDLPDQGADHIATTIEAIQQRLPACSIEMLIPDFRGVADCVQRVVTTSLRVLAHNLETVPRLYRQVRPGAVYERSLRVLALAKEFRPDIITKSGLMLGLGETREELLQVFADLRQHGCDILTLGQYLQPSADQLPVQAFITPQEFAELRNAALPLGFRHVESGPIVRTSYHAWQHVEPRAEKSEVWGSASAEWGKLPACPVKTMGNQDGYPTVPQAAPTH